MSKVEEYRAELRACGDWDEYLLANSRLPGPRGNIELGAAAAREASPAQIRAWLEWDAGRAPANTPGEFLAFCGTLGLGRLAVEGDPRALSRLRRAAGDARWRTREAVAMALQWLGRDRFDDLVTEMQSWAAGSRLEQRAAAAGLCEPVLLTGRGRVEAVLEILETITASLVGADDRRTDGFRALRQGLGYCWSVAVAAAPEVGMPAMERWVADPDPEVRRVMRQNLAKKRLERMDPAWAGALRARLH